MIVSFSRTASRPAHSSRVTSRPSHVTSLVHHAPLTSREDTRPHARSMCVACICSFISPKYVQPAGAVTLRNIGDPHYVGVPRRVYNAYVTSRAQQRLAGAISSTRIDATTARGVSPHPPVKPYSHTILCVSRAPERSPSARASLSCHVPRAAAARARAASSTSEPL